MRNIIFAAAMLVAATATASASSYVVNFSGTIDSTDIFNADIQGLPGSTFSNGDVVSGSISFDSSKTESVPFMDGAVDYQNKPSPAASAFSSLTFSIGSHDFTYTNIFDVQLEDKGSGNQAVMFAGMDGSDLIYSLIITGTNLFSDINNLDSLKTGANPASLFIVPLIGGATQPSTVIHLASATISETPIPAALPLFATALGGLGFVGWTRRKHA